MKRIFRDKLGRFTSDLRKVKTVKIGKRTYHKKDFVKQLLRKQKGIKKPKIKWKKEVYQTQIGKLEGSHTNKFYRIIPFDEIDTLKSFVESFRDFYNEIKNKVKKAYMVKFGIIAEDLETGQFISKFSAWTALIFDTKAIERLFDEISDWVDALNELAERYMVSIKDANITQIIMFKILGHL